MGISKRLYDTLLKTKLESVVMTTTARARAVVGCRSINIFPREKTFVQRDWRSLICSGGSVTLLLYHFVGIWIGATFTALVEQILLKMFGYIMYCFTNDIVNNRVSFY